MNFRTTFILGALLVGALVFVIVVNTRDGGDKDNKTADPRNNSDRGRKVFEDAKADDITKLTITPQAAWGQAVQLAKSGTTWNIVQPINWQADSFETRQLVDAVVNLRSQGSVDLTASNATSTGLDKPRYRIEATTEKGQTLRLNVGGRSALGNNLYVTAGEDTKTALLVPGGDLGGKLDKGTDKLVSTLRDKQLVRVTSNDARQVEVERPGKPRLVLHKEGGEWKVIEPEQVPAEGPEVTNLLSAVADLRAEEFSDPAAAERAGARLGEPRTVVWLSKDAPATQPTTGPSTGASTRPVHTGGVTIALGQWVDIERDKSWVRVSDPAAVAKARLTEATFNRLVEATPLSLRERKVFDVEPEQASELTLVIDRPSTTQPTTKAAEQKEFRITRRKESAVLGPMLPPPPGPTTGPTTRPTTQPTTGPTTQLAAAAGASTQPTTKPTTGPDTQPAKPPSKWVLASQGGADADDGQVTDLLGSLHPLRATKYLEKAPATQPSATYTLMVKAVAAGGDEKTHTLRITDPGGTAAPVASYNNLTFEIDRPLLQKLEGDFKTPKPAAPSFGGEMPDFPTGGFPRGGLPPGHP